MLVKKLNDVIELSSWRMKIAALSPEIKKRHTDFVAMYDKKRATLKKKVAAVDDAWFEFTKKSAYADLNAFLESVKPPSHHQKLDPNKLPNRELEIIKRDPRKSEEDYGDLRSEVEIYKKQNPSLYAEPAWDWSARKIAKAEHGDGVMVASTGLPFGLLNKEAVSFTPVDIMDTVIAQTGGADLPTAADLAPTIEAQSDRQSIIDLAAQLNHSPVEIYNWVYNNIEYVPTWGSIQGAEMCMLARKCNDMDTASLLIALLRASSSDVPARYVHGTIEVPIDKLMNWVGGFTDVNSAVGFVGAGGTPIMPIAQGGAIGKVEMEHVWVEAYVDYIPSRGAVHRTGDTWAPLDGSYKQYVYTDGIDLQAAVPFDAQAFVDQVQASATVDPVTGAVSGIDQTLIETTLTNYQTQVQDYVTATLPTATGADLIGSKTVVNNTAEFLPLSGPYTLINAGTKYAVTPDNLRHKITFSTTTYSHIGEDFSVTKSVPELAGKRITVGYNFASAVDQQTADNFGSLFTAKPALIKLRAVVLIDGVQIGQSEIKGLGDKVQFDMAFSSPYYAPEIETEDIIMGSIVSVVVNPGHVGYEYFYQKQPAIAALKDSVTLDNIYSDTYMGRLLEEVGLLYYLDLDSTTTTSKRSSNINQLRQPSRLLVSKGIKLGYMYGVPFTALEGGMVLDVDREVATTISRDGDVGKKKSFLLSRGMNMSALEHTIFDILFKKNAVSTVKIIQTAVEAGIEIVTITNENMAKVMPTLNISTSVKEDINNLLAANNVITMPAAAVNISGWSGIGYIAINQATFDGAYVIEGGYSGAWLKMLLTDAYDYWQDFTVDWADIYAEYNYAKWIANIMKIILPLALIWAAAIPAGAISAALFFTFIYLIGAVIIIYLIIEYILPALAALLFRRGSWAHTLNRELPMSC